MATDFTNNNTTISTSGVFQPNTKNTPLDIRTRVNLKADIESIPNPFVGMHIIVLQDETNNNQMTEYVVISLKANNLGIANSKVNEVVLAKDFLGVSGNGISEEQAQKLNTAYTHSQSTHVQQSDIPTKTSQLQNDSNFISEVPSEYITETELNAKGLATEIFVTNKIAEASLSGGEVDLSGYATKDELNAKANVSDIPTKTSQLTNDSDFATNASVDEKIANVSTGGTVPTNRQYSTMNDLKESLDIKKDDIVRTLGFYAIGDGGEGDYRIVDAVTHDFLCFELRNGLYAEYIIKNNTIYVDSLGASKIIDSATQDTILYNKITRYISNELGGGKVVFGNGTYYIDAVCEPWFATRPGISIYDNTVVELNRGTILKVVPNNSGFYACLWFHTVNNATILGNGATIIGDRNDHVDLGSINGDYSNEHGHCIGGFNVNNITIKDIILKDAWGDGLFFSRRDTNFEGDVTIEPSSVGNNIKIQNVICDNNRRQGFSLIHANGILIENCKFNNTNGLPPQCGIDLESNTSNDRITNVTIRNCEFLNNVSAGIGTYLAERINNVIVENCIFDSNKNGINIQCNMNNNTLASEHWIINKCVFKNMSDNSIKGNQLRYSIISDNTFYDNPIGITTCRDTKFLNNIFKVDIASTKAFLNCGFWRCDVEGNTFLADSYSNAIGVYSGSFYSNYRNNMFFNIQTPYRILQSRRNMFIENTIINCSIPFKLCNNQTSYNKFVNNYIETMGVGATKASIVGIDFSSSSPVLESIIIKDNMVLQSGCIASDIGDIITDAPSYDKCSVVSSQGMLKNYIIENNTISTYISPTSTESILETLPIVRLATDILAYQYNNITNSSDNTQLLPTLETDLVEGNRYSLVINVTDKTEGVTTLYVQNNTQTTLIAYASLVNGMNVIPFTYTAGTNLKSLRLALSSTDYNQGYSITYEIYGLYEGVLAIYDLPEKDTSKPIYESGSSEETLTNLLSEPLNNVSLKTKQSLNVTEDLIGDSRYTVYYEIISKSEELDRLALQNASEVILANITPISVGKKVTSITFKTPANSNVTKLLFGMYASDAKSYDIVCNVYGVYKGDLTLDDVNKI